MPYTFADVCMHGYVCAYTLHVAISLTGQTHTHTHRHSHSGGRESDRILQSDRSSGALDRLRLRFEVAFNSLLSATAAKCGIL